MPGSDPARGGSDATGGGSDPTGRSYPNPGAGWLFAGPGPGGPRRRHAPVDHPRGNPAVPCGDFHVLPGRDRVTGRSNGPGLQRRPHLLQQGTKVSRRARVFLQQVC